MHTSLFSLSQVNVQALAQFEYTWPSTRHTSEWEMHKSVPFKQFIHQFVIYLSIKFICYCYKACIVHHAVHASCYEPTHCMSADTGIGFWTCWHFHHSHHKWTSRTACWWNCGSIVENTLYRIQLQVLESTELKRKSQTRKGRGHICIDIS